MTQVDQQQPWTLSLRAKAKNLDFKFKLSRILAVSKLFRFSVQFRVHPYSLQIKSKPKSSFSLNPKSLKLKFLWIFKNFHFKCSKNKGIARSWFPHKNYFNGRRKRCNWLWVLLFAMVGCFIIMRLSSFLVWKCVWRAWNYAPSGFLYHFFKVI
ncbi:hypothetical protein DH2020_047985 [Rehmannia glutinosa]|uniref:Transmembrane protein n=1 Tax=Rehmannia glutinosa TaxID=99300 RepID=A0ABR0U7A0_REHGL